MFSFGIYWDCMHGDSIYDRYCRVVYWINIGNVQLCQKYVLFQESKNKQSKEK